RHGDHDAAEAAFAAAAHHVVLDLVITRVAANPIEGRGAVAVPGPDGIVTLHCSHQGPYQLRNELARLLSLDAALIRVVAPDVGGSFGMKGGAYREEILVSWAAIKTGRPVRWSQLRSEAFLSDEHSRDVGCRAELALDE